MIGLLTIVKLAHVLDKRAHAVVAMMEFKCGLTKEVMNNELGGPTATLNSPIIVGHNNFLEPMLNSF